jgi:hypothetical protein
MRRLICLVFFMATFAYLSGLFFVSPSPAATEEPILFILDASGSMWGRVGDKAKIEVAKDVLTKSLAALPAGMPVGLMAYGHTRKGDCHDIEILVSPSPGSKEQIAKRTRDLIPKGKTPISDALVKAGKSVDAENPATIILISDGIETCQGDPCAVAESLIASGAKLKVFVVGFDVAKGDAVQLQCIAEKGGGRFFNASDADSLAKALTAINKHVVEKAALPEAEKQPEPAPAAPDKPVVNTGEKKTTKVRIKGPGGILLKAASWVRTPPRSWTVIDAESGEEVGKGTGNSIRIKPGLYQIVWRQSEHESGPTSLTDVIPVESGKTSEAPLDTGIRITAPKEVKPPYYWRLLNASGEPIAHFRGDEAFMAQLVPAGKYALIWRQTEHGAGDAPLGEVEIETGKLTETILDTGFTVNLPKWLDLPYAYALKDKDGKEYRFREIGVLPFAPGEYSLIWRQTEHGHSPVDLGKMVIKEHEYAVAPINSGIAFTPFGEKPPYRFIFRSLDTGMKYIISDSFGPMPLPPGKYAVDMHERQHGSTPMTIVEEIELEPDTLLELEM